MPASSYRDWVARRCPGRGLNPIPSDYGAGRAKPTEREIEWDRGSNHEVYRTGIIGTAAWQSHLLTEEAEQNKTNICVTQFPATVSAKQNPSIIFNSGAGYSAGAPHVQPNTVQNVWRSSLNRNRPVSGQPYSKVCWAAWGDRSACWQMFTVRATEVLLGINEVTTDNTKILKG